MKNLRVVLFVVVGVAVLAGLFRWLQPASIPSATAAVAVDRPSTEPPAPAAVREVEWRITDGTRTAGPETITLHQGETLRLTVRANRADELHLHGYDRHLTLQADVPATIEFTVDRSGRFECELHRADTLVGVLAVLPP